MNRLVVIAILLMLLLTAASAEIEDKSWVFSQAGNALGWSIGLGWSSFGVTSGYWWGVSTSSSAELKSPGGLSVAAQQNHYITFRMRLRMSETGARFGMSNIVLQWITTSSTTYDDTKRMDFKAYGNNAWKTYYIPVGQSPAWTGTITRFRLYPAPASNVRVEIAYAKIVRHTDPPEFVAEHRWTYADGQETNDHTPSISLVEYWDQLTGLTGIVRAEYYWRPGNSTSEDDWVYDGESTNFGLDYAHTYTALPDGVYDLGVKVYDSNGNVGYWIHGDEKWIDDLRINSALTTSIQVDATQVIAQLNPLLMGNNLCGWTEWGNLYNRTTKRLPEALESRLQDMGTPILRYPGGCDADLFFWKKAIGPVESRPDQYGTNGCTTNVVNLGPVKFGLDEFLGFCEARNIEPMLTCRFRWPGSAGAPGIDGPDPYGEALADAVDLVEYCNSPNDGSNPNGGTDWAAVRAANGHPEPYGVKYFEIGNEPWGADPFGSPREGDTASVYSLAFLTYLEQMKAVDPTINVSPSTQLQDVRVIDRMNPTWAYSVHEQTGPFVESAQGHPYLPYSGWQTDLLKLYDETMATPKALDERVRTQRALIKLTNPDRVGTIKLRISEWDINYNWWYNPDQGRINTYHSRTLKAAIALADTFRVWLEQPELIESAEWWHLYGNSPWACIPTNTSIVYPPYHIFRIYNRHFGPEIVKTTVTGSPTFNYVATAGSVLPSEYDIPYLTATASRSTDGASLYLVVINKDRVNSRSATINIRGFLEDAGVAYNGEIWEVNGPSVDDYNNPQNITTTVSNAVFPSTFDYTFPAHSVTSFKFSAGPPMRESVGEAKSMADGSLLMLGAKPVIAVFPPNECYIEEEDRSSGIRIVCEGASVSEGNRISVVGRLGTTSAGERYLAAEQLTNHGGSVSVEPLVTLTRAFGPFDLDTNGMLVTVCGATGIPAANYFYLNDASGPRSVTGVEGVKVYCSNPPPPGKFVRVTGVRSVEFPPGKTVPEPVIRTRRDSDVVMIL